MAKQEPLEIYEDRIWEILDPNTAQIVAVFYNETAAQEYMAWRNIPIIEEEEK